MMINDKRNNPTRAFRENLPWHINGKLEADERAQLDSALAKNPSLAAERRWLESVRDHIQHDTNLPDQNIGLDKLMARIHGEQSGRIIPLQTARRPPWKRVAVAAAAMLVITQATVIGVMFKHQQQETTIAPLSGTTQPVAGTVLQVTFRASATEMEIRSALTDANAEIVGGPSALGIYTVRTIASTPDASIQKLRRSAVVESMTLLQPGS